MKRVYTLNFNPLCTLHPQGNWQALAHWAEPQREHWCHYQQAAPSGHQHRTVRTNLPGQESRDGAASQVRPPGARARVHTAQSERPRKERQHRPSVSIRRVRLHTKSVEYWLGRLHPCSVDWWDSLSLSSPLSTPSLSLFLPHSKYTEVHSSFSCVGSNTHNNGNPGGDGQTGDAGEGRGGTDRNNIVQVLDPNTNYPVPWENATLFKDAEVIWASFADDPNNPGLSGQDVATAFASSGYYRCVATATCTESVQGKNPTLQQLLNNASPSFEGAILRFMREGTYHYICSRNNNFTNRSQKGQLTVSAWVKLRTIVKYC